MCTLFTVTVSKLAIMRLPQPVYVYTARSQPKTGSCALSTALATAGLLKDAEQHTNSTSMYSARHVWFRALCTVHLLVAIAVIIRFAAQYSGASHTSNSVIIFNSVFTTCGASCGVHYDDKQILLPSCTARELEQPMRCTNDSLAFWRGYRHT
jgi:hypothetical protein